MENINSIFEAFSWLISHPKVSINGSTEHSLKNCINFSVNNVDSELTIMALKDLVAISNGSACTSETYSESHVIKAVTKDPKAAAAACRISWGPNVDVVQVRSLEKPMKIIIDGLSEP